MEDHSEKFLFWMYEGDHLGDRAEDAWNTMLKEKGYDITVGFQGITLDQSYYDTGELPDFSNVDIVSMPVEAAVTLNYAELARNGELYDWGDYLAGEAGEGLRVSMPFSSMGVYEGGGGDLWPFESGRVSETGLSTRF